MYEDESGEFVCVINYPAFEQLGPDLSVSEIYRSRGSIG